jgi:hypothetical protein
MLSFTVLIQEKRHWLIRDTRASITLKIPRETSERKES